VDAMGGAPSTTSRSASGSPSGAASAATPAHSDVAPPDEATPRHGRDDHAGGSAGARGPLFGSHQLQAADHTTSPGPCSPLAGRALRSRNPRKWLGPTPDYKLARSLILCSGHDPPSAPNQGSEAP
jgi:hypothetical protein